MKRKLILFLMTAFALASLFGADRNPGPITSKPIPIRTSEWDKNGDGKLNVSERKALLRSLASGRGPTERPWLNNATNGLHKANHQPDRLSERIRKALKGK